MSTYGQIRAALSAADARWQTDPGPDDAATVPTHPLGVGDPEQLVRAADVGAVDLARVLADHPTTNPHLAARRAALGLPAGRVSDDPLVAAYARPAAGTTDAGLSTVVDWRNRFGTNWVTGIRDQGPCGACVSFGTAGVVESRVRIEHAVWCVRSEGDAHDGLGLHCADGSWPNTYLDWIKAHGIADPGCWPYHTDNAAYAPTPDRSGRTVKIDGYTELGTPADQKTWIDTVGPITCCFAVYTDFDAYSSGVYHHTGGTLRGLHCIEVIGYDETAQCWICKNQWGAGWGDHGYVRIGYGQADVDTYAKYGIRATNPDPWTKRRLHNGNLYEGGNGAAHNNFEMVATAAGGQVQHWWRENSGSFAWARASEFGIDVAGTPTLTSTTFNRNFEAVYLTGGHRLHHWWLDQNTGKWNDGGIFGPSDAAGVPGFIQSNYGAPGNLEVVVRRANGQLQHYWRDGGGWEVGPSFAGNVAYSGASLIQGQYGAAGNLELVATLGTGQLQHWWRDDDHGFGWNAGPVFGSGITSAPVMIQGQYGMATEKGLGNFELCVAAGGQVQHWWRDNNGSGNWFRSAIFGHNVIAVTGLVEGSFGFNLEIVVLRDDRSLQHYWRDGGGWHEGPVIGPS